MRRVAGAPARLEVYSALRGAIVRGDLFPGAQLSENALAAAMGVSRTPIREALARLRDDRLVEIVPQLGTFVARISEQGVADAQFIREALECAAIRHATQLATSDDIADLEANLEDQGRPGKAGDLEAFYLLDDAFHRGLTDLSGHPTVWSVSERAKSHLNRVHRLSLGMPDYLGDMVLEIGVLDAVAAHEPDAAEDALRHHLRMVLKELPTLRRRRPDYFESQ